MAGPDRFIDKEVLQIWDHLEVFILIDRVRQTHALHVYLLAISCLQCRHKNVRIHVFRL